MPLYHQATGKIQVYCATLHSPRIARSLLPRVQAIGTSLCSGADGCRTPQYYRFDVAGHWRHVKDDNSALAFTRPMFEFVGKALARGENVLVHCLAGVCALVMRSVCRGAAAVGIGWCIYQV